MEMIVLIVTKFWVTCNDPVYIALNIYCVKFEDDAYQAHHRHSQHPAVERGKEKSELKLVILWIQSNATQRRLP